MNFLVLEWFFFNFNFYGFYLDIFLEFVVIFEDKGCFVVG